MIRGTSYDQDCRFSNKEKIILTTSQWPDEYGVQINLSKVNFEVIKEWIE